MRAVRIGQGRLHEQGLPGTASAGPRWPPSRHRHRRARPRVQCSGRFVPCDQDPATLLTKMRTMLGIASYHRLPVLADIVRWALRLNGWAPPEVA